MSIMLLRDTKNQYQPDETHDHGINHHTTHQQRSQRNRKPKPTKKLEQTEQHPRRAMEQQSLGQANRRERTNLAARCEDTHSYHLLALGNEPPGFSGTAAYTFTSSFVSRSLQHPSKRPVSMPPTKQTPAPSNPNPQREGREERELPGDVSFAGEELVEGLEARLRAEIREGDRHLASDRSGEMPKGKRRAWTFDGGGEAAEEREREGGRGGGVSEIDWPFINC